MAWVYLLIGAQIGGVVGIFVMCMLQINRDNRSNHKEND